MKIIVQKNKVWIEIDEGEEVERKENPQIRIQRILRKGEKMYKIVSFTGFPEEEDSPREYLRYLRYSPQYARPTVFIRGDALSVFGDKEIGDPHGRFGIDWSYDIDLKIGSIITDQQKEQIINIVICAMRRFRDINAEIKELQEKWEGQIETIPF